MKAVTMPIERGDVWQSTFETIATKSSRLPQMPLMEVPIPAGFPSPSRDYIENVLDLSELMIRHPAATYFVRVDGYSMAGAGILPDDILVVDRSISDVHNRIVIAMVDGDMTVKRLKIRNGETWLYPENNAFKPIKIEEWMDFHLWGVVTWVIHCVK